MSLILHLRHFPSRSFIFFTLSLCVANSSHYRSPSCDSLPFPKSYVVYSLAPTEKIVVDGILDEPAWKTVSWTEDFIDIQGAEFPKPRFATRAKMRWDSHFLYIAGYLQETDVFANQTRHDSVVFKDNDFEVFIDTDGSTQMYKEFEINAINTTWSLELNKPYSNGGSPLIWEMPTMKSAIYVDGPINNPAVKDVYWTVELAFPLKDLADNTNHTNVPPRAGDQWRINFSRVEWHVCNVNGHYEKVPNVPEDNWVWSPQYSINMHLPERWGFIQFSNDSVNATQFQKPVYWPVYTALVAVYNAEKKFNSVNGYYTANLTATEVPLFVLDGKCCHVPTVNASSTYEFDATVRPFDPKQPVGHIRDDRKIWFTPPAGEQI